MNKGPPQAGILFRTYLGGQQIALVIGTSNIDGITIGIMSGQDGSGHNVAAGGVNPRLWLYQDLVGLQTLLGTSVRNVQATVRGVHLAGGQAASEVPTTHIERLSIRGLAHT